MQKMTATDRKVRELRGDTPRFDAINHLSTDFSIQYVKALNWVHYNVDESELKAELIQCLQDRKADALVPYVGDLDGVTFSTLGKIAYCVNHGADLAPSSMLRIRNALERVRDAQTTVAVEVPVGMEYQEQTAAGRVNEIYKACYSRLDNIKARHLNGKITLEQIQDEVRGVLDAQGARAQVRKRLVDHYTQSLQEALADKLIKTWVKPLQEIVRTLGGDVQEIKQKVRKVATKEKTKAVKQKPTKVAKEKVSKPVRKTKETKTIVIKAKRDTGAPTVASQVRDLIRVHKVNMDEKGMVEMVINKLGLSKARGRSVVKAFWNKVEAG
jgi:hypothetical protein